MAAIADRVDGEPLIQVDSLFAAGQDVDSDTLLQCISPMKPNRSSRFSHLFQQQQDGPSDGLFQNIPIKKSGGRQRCLSLPGRLHPLSTTTHVPSCKPSSATGGGGSLSPSSSSSSLSSLLQTPKSLQNTSNNSHPLYREDGWPDFDLIANMKQQRSSTFEPAVVRSRAMSTSALRISTLQRSTTPSTINNQPSTSSPLRKLATDRPTGKQNQVYPTPGPSPVPTSTTQINETVNKRTLDLAKYEIKVAPKR